MNAKIIVVGLVYNRTLNSFLLIERGDRLPPWSFPGGKVEAGETEAQAVMREVKEETSIDCLPLSKLGERMHPQTGAMMGYWFCDHRGGKPAIRSTEQTKIKYADYVQPEIVLERMGRTLFPGAALLLKATIR